MARSEPKTVYSKMSVKSQTVLPREVRDRLRVGPGDRLRYVIDEQGVRIEKGTVHDEDDPFATFSEWAGEADEEAYGNL